MILSLGACDGNASAAADHYRHWYPNRRHPDRRVIQRAERTLGEYGSFEKLRRHGGRQRRVSVNVEEQILKDVLEHPDISARNLSLRYNLSCFTILRILHENNLHAYHITRVQGLMPHDKISRKAFCRWLLQQHANDAEFLLKILWTDERKFTRDGMFNVHNVHNWQNENPHSILETHFQIRWNVNVWAGIIGHLIIGPYFFEGIVTSAAYFDFLQNKLPELLEDVPLRTRGSLIFQQDGAPPHFSRHVRDFLNQHDQGWIGRARTIDWLPRSPDLTLLDFYLWSHIKSIVYSEEIASCEQFKEKIIVAFHTLKQSNTLESVHRNLIRRAEVCVLQNGQHFQQFL